MTINDKKLFKKNKHIKKVLINKICDIIYD